MSNFYKMDRSMLVLAMTNTINAINDGRVTSLLPDQRVAIVDSLTIQRDELAAANNDAIEKKTASIGANEKAQTLAKQSARAMAETKHAMIGVRAPADQFDVVGLKAPAASRRNVMPDTPTRLAAMGRWNGGVDLTWECSNASIYIIYGKARRSDPYSIIGACTAHKFFHEDVAPGQFYVYEVKAQGSGGQLSGASNTATVYANRASEVNGK